MRVELTKQECRWFRDLASKERLAAQNAYAENGNPLYELRRDNMISLEHKLNTALERQAQRERRNRDHGAR